MLSYYLLPRFFRNSVLLLFSLVFYVWGEVQYLWIIFFSILFNYSIGLLLQKNRGNKLLLTFAVIVNLGFLLFYKYLGFFASAAQIDLPESLQKLVLPLGISFYTFHSISYLIDIHRGKAVAQQNLVRMGLYIVNFPQLVAGPIVRYHDVEKQLTARRHSINRFSNGISLFVVGLAKKMLVANTMGEMADSVFKVNFDYLSVSQAWIGVLAYTLQIYFDFSGYSDMAIGLGRMFGFEFRKNFNFPYVATSIKDFWRRWHISLSTWFRDYVYIPLGGNKYSDARTAFNLFSIFVLCGLWHGPNVTFLIWGLYHGSFLALERGALGRLLKRIPLVFQHAYTWLIVMVGWVFFRAENMKIAGALLGRMFSFRPISVSSVDVGSFINTYFIFILILAVLFSAKIPYRLYFLLIRKRRFSVEQIRLGGYFLLLILFVACIAEIVGNHYNPFIYYRF